MDPLFGLLPAGGGDLLFRERLVVVADEGAAATGVGFTIVRSSLTFAEPAVETVFKAEKLSLEDLGACVGDTGGEDGGEM